VTSPAYFPPSRGNTPPPNPEKHVIADIRSTKPFYVVCSCGWRADVLVRTDVERMWKLHKSNPDGIDETEEELTA
jgi:hypothetical protein